MSVVERVAEAICRSCCDDCNGIACQKDHDWTDQARAAIAEMREPTSEMEQAAIRLGRKLQSDGYSYGAAILIGWAEMIDAALVDGTKTEPETRTK